MYGIQKDGNDNLCKTAKETQMKRTVFWTLWEKARVEWFERTAWKHVYYHMWNRSPVQVRCMRQALKASALGWPWGMGWGGQWEVVQDEGHMYTHGWFVSMYGKSHYNIVISLQLNKLIFLKMVNKKFLINKTWKWKKNFLGTITFFH